MFLEHNLNTISQASCDTEDGNYGCFAITGINYLII